MKGYNKTKLKKFILNQENKMLLIYFFTIISYILLNILFKNAIVLLCGYFFFYFIYSKLFNHIENKIKYSFKEKNSNVDFL